LQIKDRTTREIRNRTAARVAQVHNEGQDEGQHIIEKESVLVDSDEKHGEDEGSDECEDRPLEYI
jgi:hypothetical protein